MKPNDWIWSLIIMEKWFLQILNQFWKIFGPIRILTVIGLDNNTRIEQNFWKIIWQVVHLYILFKIFHYLEIALSFQWAWKYNFAINEDLAEIYLNLVKNNLIADGMFRQYLNGRDSYHLTTKLRIYPN